MTRVDAPASIDPLDLVDPDRYVRRGYPHDVWTQLRAETPVAWMEAPGFEPFWAITKHADVQSVASQPLRFSSAQGITLARAGAKPMPPSEVLVVLDPPKHGPIRRVATGSTLTVRAPRAAR